MSRADRRHRLVFTEIGRRVREEQSWLVFKEEKEERLEQSREITENSSRQQRVASYSVIPQEITVEKFWSSAETFTAGLD